MLSTQNTSPHAWKYVWIICPQWKLFNPVKNILWNSVNCPKLSQDPNTKQKDDSWIILKFRQRTEFALKSTRNENLGNFSNSCYTYYAIHQCTLFSKEYYIFLINLSLKCNNLLHPWNIFRFRLTSPRPLIFQPSKPTLITKNKIVPLYSIFVEFPVSLRNRNVTFLK